MSNGQTQASLDKKPWPFFVRRKWLSNSESESEPIPRQDQLCKACNRIPFAFLQSSRGYKTYSLGNYGEVKAADCEFCRLVKTLFRSKKNEPFDDYYWILNVYRSPKSRDISIYWTHGHLELEVYPQPTEWIDTNVVKRWISECDAQHEPKCCPEIFNRDGFLDKDGQCVPFRLIDVEEQCLVDAPKLCRYVALSYIWGEPNDGRLVLKRASLNQLLVPGSLLHEKKSIPNTIVDAMSFTAQMEQRYLWVDSLCILQDDEKESKTSVHGMTEIYSRAYFTIVAASGSDAYSGLPRVYPTARLTSLMANVAPGLVASKARDVGKALAESHYATRAWTLQEELLSSRIIAFVNGELYFRCKQVQCAEQGQSKISLSALSQYTGHHESFQRTIQTYNKRKLTFERDRYRAVIGLLQQMSQSLKVEMIEGLPPPLAITFLFYKSSQSGSCDRRQGFPSYSWTGWTFLPEWRFSPKYSSIRYPYAPTSPHSPIPMRWYLRDRAGKFWLIGLKGDLSHVTVLAVLHSFVPPSLSSRHISPKLPRLNPSEGVAGETVYPLVYFWTISFTTSLEAIVNAAQKYTITTRLDDPNFPLSQRVEIALILKEASTPPSDPLIWGLILVHVSTVAERRGIVAIQESAFNVLPTLHWKLIVLG